MGGKEMGKCGNGGNELRTRPAIAPFPHCLISFRHPSLHYSITPLHCPAILRLLPLRRAGPLHVAASERPHGGDRRAVEERERQHRHRRPRSEEHTSELQSLTN